ncbi:winged helix-turn-helix transcriptional regulator [Lysobacter sp. D1-1-M9]|uniref:winged helix-turn-helix transcriptional regulator n=1 Tax=Novilysobacter longmucuonensis TaxID=3098603 RepID=UPI002FC7111A
MTDLQLDDMRATRTALEHITNKWSVLLLAVLCHEPSRFNELLHRLDGITHKALSDALKRLERNGLVTRTVIPTKPVGVEYSITELGQSLREPIQSLSAWATQYGPALARARMAFDQAQAAPVRSNR